MVDLLEVSSKELNKLFSKATKQWKKPLKQLIFSACPRKWIFSTSGSSDKHSSFVLEISKKVVDLLQAIFCGFREKFNHLYAVI